MKNSVYIPANRVQSKAQDYEWLRNEGLRYLESIGHEQWTEYNSSDPGITIFETLIYVLTEIDYRNKFSIETLLTNSDDKIENKTFFTPNQIFSNAPLTVFDYRKLLIDIPAVANAWFLPTKKQVDADGFHLPHDQETKIYINKLEDKISLKDKNIQNEILANQINIRGLNKVVIELDRDMELGDLNSTTLNFEFWFEDRWIQIEIIPEFDSWDHESIAVLDILNKGAKQKNSKVEVIDNQIVLTISQNTRISKPRIESEAKSIRGIKIAAVEEVFKNPIDLLPPSANQLKFKINSVNSNEIPNILTYFGNLSSINELLNLYTKKFQLVSAALNDVRISLNKNRNLCEDFLCLATISSIELGICAKIQLDANTEVLDTIAFVYDALDQIINPSVQFYTLQEMLAEKISIEEIFEGPRLTHGFIKDEELIKSSLLTSLHSSDFIAAIMGLKNVSSINNFMMTAYDTQGSPIPGKINQKWELLLSGDKKVILSATRSKIQFFHGLLPIVLSERDQQSISNKVKALKSQRQSNKLMTSNTDILIQNASYKNINEHYSLQDELPTVYNVGKNQVSLTASNSEKGQNKQLRAYLHFYDQIIADLFSQLHHAKNILDIEELKPTNPELYKSYFPQFLDKNHKTGEDFYNKFLYSPDLEGFLNDKFQIETPSQFFERKNKAVDHLLARFCEDLNEYVFTMYQVSSAYLEGFDSLDLQEDLINDKIAFLRNYPKLSSERGLAIDYYTAGKNDNEPGWSRVDKSSYEKRVARLLGINNIELKDVSISFDELTSWDMELGRLNTVSFAIVKPNENLIDKQTWLEENFWNPEYYAIKKKGNKFQIVIQDKQKVEIVSIGNTFADFLEAEKFLSAIQLQISILTENFYLIEHSLLRPIKLDTLNDDLLLPVTLKEDCCNEPDADPYSFKATIVMPGYTSRFRNLSFRRYAEKVMRSEAPAHVLLRICWVGREDMIMFQNAYFNWLEIYGDYRMECCRNSKTIPTVVKTHQQSLKELVTAMNALNSIYPEGNLADCDTGITNNPIVLNNSILGTL